MPIGKPHSPGTHAAHGIEKPFKFYTGQNQNIPAINEGPPGGDGSGSWSKIIYPSTPDGWNNVRLLYSDEEIIPKLDEDYWEVPVQPAQWTTALYWYDTDEISQSAVVTFQPDEDYWAVALTPQPSQVVPQQFSFEQNEQATGLYTIAGDEDFWALGAPFPQLWPTTWPQPFIWEQNDFIFAFDEDFWTLGPQPRLWPTTYPQPWVGEQNDQATGLHTIAGDEDFWALGPAPQLWPTTYPQPWVGEQNESATGLYTAPGDEDFWALGQIWPNPYGKPLADTDDVVPQPSTLQPDEDFWGLGQVWPNSYLAAFSDTDDSVPQPTVTSLDEDFWTGQQVWANAASGQYWYDTDEVIPKLDEDYALPVVAWQTQQNGLYWFDTDEIFFFPDEDYWAVQAQSIASGVPVQFSDDSDFVFVQTTPLNVDEDYQFTSPTIWTIYPLSQYIPVEVPEAPAPPPVITQLYTITLLGAGPA